MMCCKLLDIARCEDGSGADFPFDKPAGMTCKHCDPGHGCKIFGTAEFPALCKSYLCLWKQVGPMPEDSRPDLTRAIFEPRDPLPEFPDRRIVRVIVDPHREITEQFMQFLDSGMAHGLTFVVRYKNGNGFAVCDDLKMRTVMAAKTEEW